MKRAVLISVALLTGLGIAEAGLRLYGFGRGIRYRTNPRLGWEMVPEQHAFNVRGRVAVRVNRLGFRGPEVVEPRPAGLVRVLFVGDGSTLNNQTAESATFPFLVAAGLERRWLGRRIEPIVAAVSGYQLEQEDALLREHVAALRPDAVVLGFCWNDWSAPLQRGPSGAPVAFGEYTGESSSLGRTAIADFWDRLGRALARRRTAAVAAGQGAPQAEDEVAVWQHVEASLDSIASRCAATGAVLVLAVLPAQMTSNDPRTYARRRELLQDWAARHAAAWVDPAPQFATAAARGAELYLDFVHLGSAAQPVVAAAVIPVLAAALENTPAARATNRTP